LLKLYFTFVIRNLYTILFNLQFFLRMYALFQPIIVVKETAIFEL